MSNLSAMWRFLCWNAITLTPIAFQTQFCVLLVEHQPRGVVVELWQVMELGRRLSHSSSIASLVEGHQWGPTLCVSTIPRHREPSYEQGKAQSLNTRFIRLSGCQGSLWSGVHYPTWHSCCIVSWSIIEVRTTIITVPTTMMGSWCQESPIHITAMLWGHLLPSILGVIIAANRIRSCHHQSRLAYQALTKKIVIRLPSTQGLQPSQGPHHGVTGAIATINI